MDRLFVRLTGTCYRPDGGWRTPGWYRMTRSRFLSELLPASAQPLHSGRWPYVVAAPSLEARAKISATAKITVRLTQRSPITADYSAS